MIRKSASGFLNQNSDYDKKIIITTINKYV